MVNSGTLMARTANLRGGGGPAGGVPKQPEAVLKGVRVTVTRDSSRGGSEGDGRMVEASGRGGLQPLLGEPLRPRGEEAWAAAAGSLGKLKGVLFFARAARANHSGRGEVRSRTGNARANSLGRNMCHI